MVKYCSRPGKCEDLGGISLELRDSVNAKITNVKPNLRVQLSKEGLPKGGGPIIKMPADAAGVIRDIADMDREQFRAIHLNTKNKVVGTEVLGIGLLDSALISIRETFKGAILNNSNRIIVAHNHPSGDPTPSVEDVKVCKKLRYAGQELGIPVLDCLVVGKNSFESAKDEADVD